MLGGGSHLKGVIGSQAEARHWHKQQTEDGGEQIHVVLPHKRHELPLQQASE